MVSFQLRQPGLARVGLAGGHFVGESLFSCGALVAGQSVQALCQFGIKCCQLFCGVAFGVVGSEHGYLRSAAAPIAANEIIIGRFNPHSKYFLCAESQQIADKQQNS